MNHCSSLTFAHLRQYPIVMSRAGLELSGPLSVDIDMTTGQWSAGPGTFTWLAPQMHLAGYQATVQLASLTLDRAEGSAKAWNAQATAMINGLTIVQPSSLPMNVTVRMNS